MPDEPGTMIYDAEDLVAELSEALGSSFDELVRTVDRRGEQLAIDMVDGRVLPKAEAAAMRSGLIAHLRDEVVPRVPPHRALVLLDVLLRRGHAELEPLRRPLEAARVARARPPAPPDWPELAAIRALPPAVALLPPGITDVAFAGELADRGLPVPRELLELLAATDGLVLRNRATDEVVFRLEPAAMMAIVERDGRDVLRIGSWWLRPMGHSRETIELWLEDGMLTGAYERSHPSQPLHRLRFDTRAFHVRAMLRFALSRVDAAPETDEQRELGFAPALYAERSWGWYLASDDERFELLVRAGRRAAARAYAEEKAADLQYDVESSTRAGDHGEASKADRERDTWLDRLRTLA